MEYPFPNEVFSYHVNDYLWQLSQNIGGDAISPIRFSEER